MNAAPETGTPRFAPGARVRVKDDWPETRGPCHIRTPHYVRGRMGQVVRP
ncbi:MAG: SH3-like domain-containing protein, partial [Alphaproteobacteria bacterium]